MRTVEPSSSCSKSSVCGWLLLGLSAWQSVAWLQKTSNIESPAVRAATTKCGTNELQEPPDLARMQDLITTAITQCSQGMRAEIKAKG